MTPTSARAAIGRALVAIRDAEVAAEASASPSPAADDGLPAGRRARRRGGGLFASLQSYITPDAFTFEMSVLFFIAILIGGRGSILGPLLGTIILTALPSSRAAGAVVDLPLRRAAAGDRAADPGRHRRPARLQEPPAARAASRDRAAARAAGARARRKTSRARSTLKDIALHFGGVRAIDGLDLEIRSGEVHGLIGPTAAARRRRST
jgi:hypothetical protein